MNYKTRQAKAKLSSWYICHKLNLKYKEYIEIRIGRKNLANEKLDLFLQLTDPVRKEYLNQQDEERAIEKWYVENSYKDIKSLIKEFKLQQSDIAEDLGCDASSISRAIKWCHEPSDIKYLIYYYLHDDNNRRQQFKYSRKRGKKPVKIETEEHIEKEDKNLVSAINDEGKWEKVDIWYDLFQKMSNKYHDTLEELNRIKYLVDEIRKRDKTIQDLTEVKKGKDNENSQ